MSEIPERKVLKEVLSNLKSKSLSSNMVHKQQITLTRGEINTAIEWIMKKTKGKADFVSFGLMSLLQRVQLLTEKLVLISNTAISDMESYIDALERYSTNLDNTLTKIFEQARKVAEEQIKQQEELMKRKPPSEPYV